jgi:hypothetical protein
MGREIESRQGIGSSFSRIFFLIQNRIVFFDEFRVGQYPATRLEQILTVCTSMASHNTFGVPKYALKHLSILYVLCER